MIEKGEAEKEFWMRRQTVGARMTEIKKRPENIGNVFFFNQNTNRLNRSDWLYQSYSHSKLDQNGQQLGVCSNFISCAFHSKAPDEAK